MRKIKTRRTARILIALDRVLCYIFGAMGVAGLGYSFMLYYFRLAPAWLYITGMVAAFGLVMSVLLLYDELDKEESRFWDRD